MTTKQQLTDVQRAVLLLYVRGASADTIAANTGLGRHIVIAVIETVARYNRAAAREMLRQDSEPRMNAQRARRTP